MDRVLGLEGSLKSLHSRLRDVEERGEAPGQRGLDLWDSGEGVGRDESGDGEIFAFPERIAGFSQVIARLIKKRRKNFIDLEVFLVKNFGAYARDVLQHSGAGGGDGEEDGGASASRAEGRIWKTLNMDSKKVALDKSNPTEVLSALGVFEDVMSVVVPDLRVEVHQHVGVVNDLLLAYQSLPSLGFFYDREVRTKWSATPLGKLNITARDAALQLARAEVAGEKAKKEASAGGSAPAAKRQRVSDSSRPDNFCYNFNKVNGAVGCERDRCKFVHGCPFCKEKGHTFSECKKAGAKDFVFPKK